MVTRMATARAARVRAFSTPRRSAAASGTIALAASVGVEARWSATKSSSGVSTSWPIALTTGVRAEATARISVSLLKGRRSSTLPPPRVMTMTSTSGSASSSVRAAVTSAAEPGPWTATWRISNRTPGQRRLAFSTTSFSAALARPQTSPTRRGRNGSRCLRSASNSPCAARVALRYSRRARSSPTPTGRICRPSRMRVPRWVQNAGLAWTTTRAPWVRGLAIASSALTEMATERDRSTSASRRVRYAVRTPGRRLSWTTCPSTHRTDIFSTYSAILMLSNRTGHGCSAVVSAARSGSSGVALTVEL